MTCMQIALALSALGGLAIGTIFTFGGVTVYHRRLHFRNIRWRLAWRAAWLSFFLGVALSAVVCGSPADS